MIRRLARFCALVALLLTFSLSALSAESLKTELFHGAGSPSENFDIVFLADGYLKQDQALLQSHAKRALKRLLNVSPFRENSDQIKAHLVLTYSEKGKRYGEADFRYGSSEGQRNRVRVARTGQAKKDAKKAVPEADSIVLLTRLKGRSHGGRGLVVLTENGYDAIAHELGHSLGRLADEYESRGRLGDRKSLPKNSDLKAPNVSKTEFIDTKDAKTIAKTAKWGHFLDLPDAYPLVSAYQGGYYRSVDVWRPSFRCLMRNSKQASFCPVCHERMTRRLYKNIGRDFDHKAYHQSYPLKDWK